MVNDGQDIMQLSQELLSMQFIHSPGPISRNECKSYKKTHQLVQYRNTNAKEIQAFFFLLLISCVFVMSIRESDASREARVCSVTQVTLVRAD